MRILIVEDDHKLGALLHAGLREEGFDVEWVKSGEEGIARALAEPYDLMLLDYMLPKRSGREVAREVRAAGRSL
ncbi:MAG TPA: response regulator, partial [Gemmatimonadales bacterium]|nr:response regulator [Gemmatimonadales bacterium]